MGLDMSSAENYIRSNWSGVRAFYSWCAEKDLPNPFPGWNGGNMESMYWKDHAKDWKEWRKAFAKKFPHLVSEYGSSHMIQLTQDINPEDGSDFVVRMAMAYYIMLGESLKNKTDIWMG